VRDRLRRQDSVAGTAAASGCRVSAPTVAPVARRYRHIVTTVLVPNLPTKQAIAEVLWQARHLREHKLTYCMCVGLLTNARGRVDVVLYTDRSRPSESR
jgi:hypothetical protein